ncbi:DUF1488 domain-containing protein [Kaistia dalseonensis]|uniref:DUF1488 domain-containing protein n=1 Tax=Kaistia dalseonensis TaxID=410840 RepID=A0ABU0H6X5_9HYPH|nr:DUF1488 domain-containing protein [Kaistia dalseonensis]MCX5495474.1 DUF1488 domain-containing protein [Kaistia dalseonensis]MDQ0438065.1 hypothetical protein [Kaistia dalseonensis]
MDIQFPNRSRSYNETRGRIQFWGYDSTIEVSFFLDAGALQRINPSAARDETGSLGVFDANRDRIEQAAARIYSRRSGSSYTLTAADL